MLRTNEHLLLALFFCLIFINPAFAQTQSESTDAVNQQLNNAELPQDFSGLKSGSVEKEFHNMPVDAQKEFPERQVDAQKEFPGMPVDAEKEFPAMQVNAEKEFSNS